MTAIPPEADAPRNGIHAMWVLSDGTGIGVCCECRAQTYVHIDTSEVTDMAHIDLAEQAFTCDGCGTTHWFRITPLSKQES